MILANARATASMPAAGTSSGMSQSVCLCSGERMSCTDGASLSMAIISPVARPSIAPITVTPKVS